LRNYVIAMNNRANAAKDMARVHSPEAELRLARFDNDDLKNATLQMSACVRDTERSRVVRTLAEYMTPSVSSGQE
jgi:hypothetical protein